MAIPGLVSEVSEGHKGQSQDARRGCPKTSNCAINWVVGWLHGGRILNTFNNYIGFLRLGIKLFGGVLLKKGHKRVSCGCL